jgi:hypothetical protein
MAVALSSVNITSSYNCGLREVPIFILTKQIFWISIRFSVYDQVMNVIV